MHIEFIEVVPAVIQEKLQSKVIFEHHLSVVQMRHPQRGITTNKGGARNSGK